MSSHLAPNIITAACLFVASASAGNLHAQEAAPEAATDRTAQLDARWRPWLGCWELDDESVRRATPGELLQTRPLGRTGGNGVRVCVEPADDAAGVVISTLVGDQRAIEEAVVANGSQRPIDDGECRGWQLAEWSANGDRLFSRAELTCPGEAPRTVSHLAMMLSGTTWLDVQGIVRDGRESVRVRHYRRLPDHAVAGAREAATAVSPRARFDVGDVKEASDKVAPAVLQAALVESRARFALDGRTLLALEEAGVAAEVTDLMVALTFPDRFRVERASSAGSGFSGWGITDWGFVNSYLWSYAPFGYSSLAFGSPGYGFVPILVGEGEPDRPETVGRVVNHRGYTRIRSREVSSASPRSGRTDPTSGVASTPGASGASSGGSSGGVSTQGYSGGSSSGSSSGRTARPRRPPK